MPAAASPSNISRLKIVPAPTATSPRRPLRPRLFGRVKVSAGEQKILAIFVSRVNELADGPEYRLRYGCDRDARVIEAFSQAAQLESEMLVVLALMLSLPELPVPVVFKVLEAWSGA
jgi:hypothetical protein